MTVVQGEVLSVETEGECDHLACCDNTALALCGTDLTGYYEPPPGQESHLCQRCAEMLRTYGEEVCPFTGKTCPE